MNYPKVIIKKEEDVMRTKTVKRRTHDEVMVADIAALPNFREAARRAFRRFSRKRETFGKDGPDGVVAKMTPARMTAAEKRMVEVFRVGLQMALEVWLESDRPRQVARQFLAGDILKVHPTITLIANDVPAFRAAVGLSTSKRILAKARRTQRRTGIPN